MTDPRQPAPGRPAPNPLGRIALILAIVHVAISAVLALGQPIAFSTLTGTAAPVAASDMILSVSTVVQAASFLFALAALIVGAFALRRAEESRIAAAIAIGVGGSSVIGFALAAAGSFIGAAMSSTPV